MADIAKPLRIEPAFDDRDAIRQLFDIHGPYPAAARYLPDGSEETGEPRAPDTVLPWFRSTWALGGQPCVEGALLILLNPRFLAAAQSMYPRAQIIPKTVVVNVNPPMPAGVPHVDVPSFHGATRETLPLRLLIAMGASGLFEPWRVVEAGAIAWFYQGTGGAFDYWPDGPRAAMCVERPPFGNVAIVADNDRMYHRIGRVGNPDDALPRMSASAEIRVLEDRHWGVFDGGELRARYARERVRLSVLWKAEVVPALSGVAPQEQLARSAIVERLETDLARRAVRTPAATEPLNCSAWIDAVYRVYAREAAASAPPER